ncbi:sigma-70 family RNA polymerase sigma factor [Actinoplanes sp. NPDC051861]|uniref:sigma-70 family RNA polymerase sigma factor n=1 Tax=Actinoplanes sp. NPDC051861 TaxID=3155170 RepID=UPI0034445F02
MTSDIDEAEFEAFVRTIRNWLRREAYDICGDWHEADDLVQMALYQVYRRWNALDRRTELGAYARLVVKRSYLTERRRSRWRHEVPASEPADDSLIAAAHADVDVRVMLLPFLRRLGSRQRAVLALRFLRDLSVEQTARELGCTTGTVTSQTVRALNALRRDLEA